MLRLAHHPAPNSVFLQLAKARAGASDNVASRANPKKLAERDTCIENLLFACKPNVRPNCLMDA